jgi:ATP-dependent DNA helicase RecG
VAINLSGTIDGEQSGDGGKDDRLNDRLSDRLNSREKRVLQVLSETPGLRTNELSSLIEVSIPTLSRTLKNLINLGLIEYRGAKKTGGYFVLPNK